MIESVASRPMVRLRDVAARAGVSLSVASRALTKDVAARISDETRARVEEAAAELNYVPDHRARALRLSRSGAIALVVPEVNNALFAAVHAGVHEVCTLRKISVLLGQIDPSDLGQGAALSSLIGNGRVDGVVLQRSEQFSDDDVSEVIDVDVPVILFNSSLPTHVGSVALDDHAAVQVAVEHLTSLGHRDVAYIGGPTRHDAAFRRRVAFDQLAATKGLRTLPEWDVPGGWDAPAGHAAMTALLEAGSRPTAVLVANINAAVGALAAAAARDVTVPDELSVVAIHDTWIGAYTCPALTTVLLPMEEAGVRAATMLLDHLDGGALEDVVVSSPAPTLVLRDSTAPPR